MRVGFIVTRTQGETGFETFLNLANLYVAENELTIYLIGNGVYCARDVELNKNIASFVMEKSRVKAMRDDLRARGITDEDIMEGVEPLESYDEMVHEIMEELDQILSF